MLTVEQLLQRRNAIGASEAAAAVGLSPWLTPYELWCDKTGEGSPIEENEWMEWGSRLEASILKKYCDVHGVTPEAPCAWRVSKHFAFMGCTPDALLDDRVIEVKTARFDAPGWGEPGTEQIPRQYYLQVVHQMIVTERAIADVAVLFGGSRYCEYTIHCDPEIANLLIEQERDFWRHVEEGTPPEAVSISDATAQWPVDLEERAVATPEIEEAVLKLHELRLQEATLEHEIERVGVDVRKHMNLAGTLLTPEGRVLATWKTQSRQTLDITTFKHAHPDLYKQFARPQSTRVFRLSNTESTHG